MLRVDIKLDAGGIQGLDQEMNRQIISAMRSAIRRTLTWGRNQAADTAGEQSPLLKQNIQQYRAISKETGRTEGVVWLGVQNLYTFYHSTPTPVRNKDLRRYKGHTLIEPGFVPKGAFGEKLSKNGHQHLFYRYGPKFRDEQGRLRQGITERFVFASEPEKGEIANDLERKITDKLNANFDKALAERLWASR